MSRGTRFSETARRGIIAPRPACAISISKLCCLSHVPTSASSSSFQLLPTSGHPSFHLEAFVCARGCFIVAAHERSVPLLLFFFSIPRSARIAFRHREVVKFTQMWSSMVDAQLIASYDRTEVTAEGLENAPKDEVLWRLFSDTSTRTLTLVPSTLEVRVLLFACVVCHSHSSYAQDGLDECATCGVQPGRSRCA